MTISPVGSALTRQIPRGILFGKNYYSDPKNGYYLSE